MRQAKPWIGWGNITNITVEIARDFLPKQLEVLEALKEKTTKFVLYSGAFRAGKTLLLANIAIRTCIENPGCVGFLGSLTYPQLRDVVFTVFKQEIEYYQKALDKKGVPITLITKLVTSTGAMRAEFWNGSMIHFKACNDELKLRGYTLDFFGLDEPIDIDETIFTQLVGRISGNVLKKPFGILTTNPGSENHWIYRRFFESGNPKYKTIKTTTYDNKLLPDYGEYIKSLQENFDDDWIKRFLDGDWGAFSGQIYKEFNPSVHVGDFTKRDDIKYYIAGVDYGTRNACCILTIGVTDKREAIVVDEWYHSGKTSRETCERLKYLDSKRYHYRKIFVDPASLDLITQCKQAKLPVEGGENKVEPGIAKVKSLIKKGLLFIDKHCLYTIKEMQSYRYERDKLNHNPSEKPLKVDDHSCDALRYALFSFKAWKIRTRIGWVKQSLWDY